MGEDSVVMPTSMRQCHVSVSYQSRWHATSDHMSWNIIKMYGRWWVNSHMYVYDWEVHILGVSCHVACHVSPCVG
jgi:hypothetical protein